MPEEIERLPRNDAQADGAALRALQAQIEAHRETDRKRSLLGQAVDAIWRSDENSLSRMERLQADAEDKARAGDSAALSAMRQEIEGAIRSDLSAVKLQDEISHYGAGFLKNAALFMRGRLGLAGSVALFALDELRPADSFQDQLADLGLGASKGALMKGAFHFLGQKDVGIAAKGIGLGASLRLTELGLSRRNYIDESTGELSLAHGLKKTVSGTLDKHAVLADAIIFGVAHGLFAKADSLSHGALKQSPLLSTVFTGTTFGMSAGAYHEFERQRLAGEELNVGKVVARSLLQGGLDSLAAVPGGMQNRAHFARQAAEKERAATLRALSEKLSGSEGTTGRRSVLLSPEALRQTDSRARQATSLAGEKTPLSEAIMDLTARPAETLASLSERLGPPVPGKHTFRLLKEGSRSEYEDVTRPVRVYTAKEGGTEIIVPEDYASALEGVRRLRQLQEGQAIAKSGSSEIDPALLKRALPEDILAALELLPDRTLVRRVILSNEANPEDAIHREKTGDAAFESAAATSRFGEVTFFKRNVDAFLAEDLFHEWAHVLKYEKPALSRMFDMAAEFEKDGYFSRERGKVDADENWAVHMGEQLLNPSQAEFRALVEKAPLRALVLGRALKSALDSSIFESPNAEAMRSRVEFIEKHAGPRALAQLSEKITTAEGAEQQAAAKLLLYLENGSTLARLQAPTTLDLANELLGDAHIRGLRSMSALEDLNLTRLLFTDAGAEIFPTLTGLRRLSLRDTRAGNAALMYIKDLPRLEELDLARTQVSDSAVPWLAQMKNLRLLNLTGTRLSARGLSELERGLPKTHVVN